jgi:integrase
MALFKVVVEAYVASKELDSASLSRLAFWVDELGDREVAAITADDIDMAMVKLAERGRLKAGRGMSTAGSGKPLAGSTINRYLTQAGSIFKHAKRLKLVPRAFIAPTRGIERSPERPDPERYLRPEEVERVLAVARVMDRTWGKMPALIVVAYHAGLRVGSVLRARGRDLDLDAGTLTINRTKNGDPITAVIAKVFG